MPAGTILYHGRSSDDRPITLDWLATDPEHSLLFCWGKCYLYTYVTTRPLRLAYFDGYSAAQSIYSGALDAQDIVIWGKVRPDMIRNKFVRIQELCKWGKQFKLDGFVRYLFQLFLPLTSPLTGFFFQDGNGLVSILVYIPGRLIYGPTQ